MGRWPIENTDPRYYRDKYLGLLFILSVITAAATLSGWPPTHLEALQATKLSIVAAVCLAFSAYRLVLLSALFAFAAIRLLISAAFNASRLAIVLALVAGTIAMAIILTRLAVKGDYTFPYQFKRYTLIEYAIDMIAFLLMLALIRELIS